MDELRVLEVSNFVFVGAQRRVQRDLFEWLLRARPLELEQTNGAFLRLIEAAATLIDSQQTANSNNAGIYVWLYCQSSFLKAFTHYFLIQSSRNHRLQHRAGNNFESHWERSLYWFHLYLKYTESQP
jgi:hypothetical protein